MAVKRRGGGERSEKSRLNAGGIATGADVGVGRCDTCRFITPPARPVVLQAWSFEESVLVLSDKGGGKGRGEEGRGE